MSDEPVTRVAVLAPDPETGRLRPATVDAADVDAVKKIGGHVLTPEELATQRSDAEYASRSTASKVGGAALALTPVLRPLQSTAAALGVTSLAPEHQAFEAGLGVATSGGLEEAATKNALTLVAGKAAGKAYGQQVLDSNTAHPNIHTAGEVAGFVQSAVQAGATGGVSSGAKGFAGGLAGGVGGLAEQGAAKVLAPIAARGAIGRALATGGEFAARGAVEGALYSGASQVTEDMLGDKDVVADKVFAAMGTGALYGGAGGAALGGAGSLAASGARGVIGGARGAIGRALATTSTVEGKAAGLAAGVGAELEGAAGDAAAQANYAARKAAAEAENALRAGVAGTAEDAVASGKSIAEATGTNTAQESSAYRSWVDKVGSKDYQKGAAYDQAWKAIGAGNGLQSTSFAKSAERYLPNGVKDVGEVMLRKGIINAEDGLLNAARHGTPEELLPRIEAEKAIVGSRIGDITSASPARIDGQAIDSAIQSVTKKYTESFATKPVGAAVQRYGEGLMEHIGVATRDAEGKLVINGNVSVQDLLRERKAIDNMVFEGVALDPSMTIEVKRELRSKIEGLIMDGMDEAGGKLPGELKAEYKALKHDYTALSIANDAAEDSAARMSKAATFGLSDTLRGGGSILKTIGSKVVRERGNAAAAVLLYRVADMGTLSKAIAATDEQVGRAAKGLLAPPTARPLPEPPSTESLRVRAARVMDHAAEAQADPARLADRIAQHTDRLTTNAPNLAAGLGSRMTSAYAMLASKIPVHADPDPFDPHPVARLSDAQAATVVRYGAYIERPMRFFEEVEHGKVTPEGVEVARTLMPGMFAELQQRTVEGLADLMARGQKPPFAQRERLGVLLDIPATTSQRPTHMLLLQQNLLESAQANKPPAQVPGAQAPKRPFATKSQPSTLDRLEGR